MAIPEGALHFQREAPCGTATTVEGSDTGSAKPDVAAESPSNTEVKAGQEQAPLPATHQLVAGCATPLSPGARVAEGAVISGTAELSIESGTSIQLNGLPAEGVISLSAGDRLTAAGVEVLFIAVEP